MARCALQKPKGSTSKPKCFPIVGPISKLRKGSFQHTGTQNIKGQTLGPKNTVTATQNGWLHSAPDQHREIKCTTPPETKTLNHPFRRGNSCMKGWLVTLRSCTGPALIWVSDFSIPACLLKGSEKILHALFTNTHSLIPHNKWLDNNSLVCTLKCSSCF